MTDAAHEHLERQIAAIVAEAIAARTFPGAVVLVARDDQILHFAAYGTTAYTADVSQPVQCETIYDIASLTKVFTATAVLRLYEAGRLQLTDPVAAHLQRLPHPAITLLHLLTHTSGLNRQLSALRDLPPEQLLTTIYETPVLHAPGTAVAYTNINALLLGLVVEHVTGLSLDAAINDLVVQPLGLRVTQFRPAARARPAIAPTEHDTQWRRRLVHGEVHDESAYALGGVAGHAGMFSDAIDLWHFCRAWLPPNDTVAAGPLLKPETIALAQHNHTAALEKGCGLGWMIDRTNFMGDSPPGSYGHTGFTGPAVVLIPQSRLIVIVLNNRIYPERRPPQHHAVIAAITTAAYIACQPGIRR
ncbi:MAG TPA: serine hydrolase domain-containing protein [Roseiflexaceae bacterium]|nr:serine hydrolase domain-containing protein [Roseiflexaceae bacterium]